MMIWGLRCLCVQPNNDTEISFCLCLYRGCRTTTTATTACATAESCAQQPQQLAQQLKARANQENQISSKWTQLGTDAL